MIHVCYCLYDKDGRYSKFTGTSMLSLFENTSAEVTVHILHDNTLTQDNREKFIYLAGRYNQIVKFYNVEILCADKIDYIVQSMPKILQAKYTVATFYRFLIPEILAGDLTKAIYLDSDIIVNLDINELWKIELADKTLGAVPETYSHVPNFTHPICRENVIDAEDYFNAGVLLINIIELKRQADLVIDGIKFMAANPQYDCFDQDILNYCFSKNYLKLPQRFNLIVEWARINNDDDISQRICHFTTSSRGQGFGLDVNDNFNRMFMKYFLKTPWFNEDSIGGLFNQVRSLYAERQNFAIQISALLAGNRRAFFVDPQSVDAVKNIFYVKPNEEIIVADTAESLQKMIESLKNAADKKVFFVLAGQYAAIRIMLMQNNFVEGRDFINGMAFLSDANGVRLNSYPLLKAM